MENAITQFKTRALALLEKVRQNGTPLVVLKRGKPLVKVVPLAEKNKVRDLAGTIVSRDDDLFSTGEAWAADA